RGEPARDVLPAGLRAAGAHVDEVLVYRTLPAEVDEAALRDALVRGALDALTFTSGSAVRRFAACLDGPAHAAARRLPIAAIGENTAAALRAAGLRPEGAAEAAAPAPAGGDLDALVAALADHWAAAPRGATDPTGGTP